MGTKLNPFGKSSQVALYGPDDWSYEDVDLEKLELCERATQALSRAYYEEEES